LAFPVGLPAGTLFHPTFLYEIIWNLLGVAVILYLERKFRLRFGQTLGAYLIWYGLGRSFFESIRIDPSEIYFGIRTNIWAAFAAILVGLIIIFVQRHRHPGVEPSPYVPGREWIRPDAGVEFDDSDSESEDDITADQSDDAEDHTESPEAPATSTSASRL